MGAIHRAPTNTVNGQGSWTRPTDTSFFFKDLFNPGPIWGPDNTPFGNNGRNVSGRRDIKCRIKRLDTRGAYQPAPDPDHLFRTSFLHRDHIPIPGYYIYA